MSEAMRSPWDHGPGRLVQMPSAGRIESMLDILGWGWKFAEGVNAGRVKENLVGTGCWCIVGRRRLRC